VKSVAKEFGVPIVLLCQLSRASEKRDDKRPMLSDLRDSGALEQDADVIIGLHRDAYYSKEAHDPQEPQEAEAIVLKERDGETGPVPIRFVPCRTFFYEPMGNGYE
jgi:replicative DNA helicase